jgi:hypothetical protein
MMNPSGGVGWPIPTSPFLGEKEPQCVATVVDRAGAEHRRDGGADLKASM